MCRQRAGQGGLGGKGFPLFGFSRALPACACKGALLLCLAALFCLALAPAPGLAREQTFTVSKPFYGPVLRPQAAQAARTEAELQAHEHAVRQLAALPEIRMAGSLDNASSSPPFDLKGLSRMLYTARAGEAKLQGFPPHVSVSVTVTLLPQQEDLRAALLQALQQPGRLELYSLSAAMQERSLEQYNQAFPALMDLPLAQMHDAGLALPLQQACGVMQAMQGFQQLLPQYSEGWAEPEKALTALEELLPLAPQNPLLLTGIAEASLALDRANLAADAVQQALDAAPEFAKAHDIQGAVYLRRHLPALASAAFSRAIELAPERPLYYLHRASALLVQEETERMCRDFKQACALGRCEGLEWAMENGKCLPAEAAEEPLQNPQDGP